MILICYDGSPDSRSAIERGGELLKGQPACVLTVWQPFFEVVSRAYGGWAMSGMIDQVAIDRAAGLDAEPRTSPQLTTAAEAILTEAEAIEATAILIGSRGLGALKSVFLGSVSHGVLQRADRPVIVVPSAGVATAREHERAESTKD